jgi:DNA invertase Pin-like site-specific DNA recombinase
MNKFCKFCYRPITQDVIDEKRRRKVENARNSARKAKLNGNRGGRKKIRDDEQIKRLREQGLTMREIAAEIGLSTTAVQRGLNDYKTKD